MASEIERKFIVDHEKWRPGDAGVPVVQGYLPVSGKTAVRVRITGPRAFLSIKGENRGPVRSEFEYPIPLSDARQMLSDLCVRPFIEKTRYYVPHAGFTWEVDVFAGENAGLIVAEIELISEDQEFILPPWVKAEVTHDPRYYNANLVANPYSRW